MVRQINPLEKLLSTKMTVAAIIIPKIQTCTCLEVSGDDNPLRQMNNTPETK